MTNPNSINPSGTSYVLKCTYSDNTALITDPVPSAPGTNDKCTLAFSALDFSGAPSYDFRTFHFEICAYYEFTVTNEVKTYNTKSSCLARTIQLYDNDNMDKAPIFLTPLDSSLSITCTSSLNFPDWVYDPGEIKFFL